MNNIIAFFSSLLFITIAEMGDKTQLLVLGLTNKYRPITILTGIFLGSLLSNSLAIFIGKSISLISNMDIYIKLIASLTFIVFGFINIAEKKEKNFSSVKANTQLINGLFFIAFSIFIGELGDKTNISTIMLTTQFNNAYIPILLGATFGMVLSNVLTIFIGKFMTNKINSNTSNVLATALFIIFGLISLFQIIDKYVFSSIIYSIVSILLISIFCIIVCKNIYMRKEKLWITNNAPI